MTERITTGKYKRGTHVTLNLTNAEVRTINSIARNCRELCNMSSGGAGRAGLRKDLDTIIAKCERALDDQVKMKELHPKKKKKEKK